MAGYRSAAAWFRREDYERIRAVVDDPDNLPETFDEWLNLAEQHLADFAATGIAVEKVIVDPDGLRAFCAQGKIKADAEGRAKYAAHLLSIEKPGHG